VVTGDLAETGDEGEFDQAYDFLVALAERLELDRNRFVVIPGNHDVNRLLCQAHFIQEQAHKRRPEPPYWPKWKFFDALLRRFYGVDTVIGFAVGAEWSLVEIPDHKIVVAGLNSTMAETHEEHYGWLGEHQLRTVAEALGRYERDGWLRIGAVHHNPIRGATADDENLRDADDLDRILGPHLNLLLHGHTHDGQASWLSQSTLPVVATGSAAVGAQARPAEVPNQYQLLRIDRGGFTRYARRYEPDQKRWTGDLRVDPAGDSWSVRTPSAFRSVHAAFPAQPPLPDADDDTEGEAGPHRRGQHGRGMDGGGHTDGSPGSPRRPPDRLDDVAEVARLRHPDATVTRIEASGKLPAHLRIHRAEGRVIEQRVVGLVDGGPTDGTVDAAAVDTFATTVLAPYLATFTVVFADLVYAGGTQATPELVDHAERLGVTLLSMPEYQGVLDLRGYIERQTDRLRTDRDYPPELYVPQRIRRVERTVAATGGPMPPTALDQIIT
ncbi:metallophosphoesterase, partial [Frankia sp. CiP3]|uniref:metallophosphoesterase family protein n=1 Tax=Frankia sp. CiP3 TaxID=2880971 RepID=UPI001EF58532